MPADECGGKGGSKCGGKCQDKCPDKRDGHVRRLTNIPCIVAKCRRMSTPGHAICQHHLVYEVIILTIGGFAGVGILIVAMFKLLGP